MKRINTEIRHERRALRKLERKLKRRKRVRVDAKSMETAKVSF